MLEIVAIIGNFFPSSQASSLGECSLRHRSQRPHILFMIAFNRHEAWSKSVNVTHTSRLRIVSQTSKSVTMKSPNNLIKVFVLCLSCCVISILAQRPDFQAPFHCGQKWTANTYSKHAPDANSIDLDLYDASGSNIGDFQPVIASAAGKERLHVAFRSHTPKMENAGSSLATTNHY